ncbi:lipase/acyltransferase domain-containing protein [Paraburkholderia madseniana]|nr:hypothetical protein [Paraburkholderia madseniana]
MHAVFFIPGIMGTRLLGADGQEVWPPTLIETQVGYRRTDQLLAESVRHGEIIRNVSCFSFYGPILDQLKDLGFREDGGHKRLYQFPYDWRKDLEDTAQLLADQIDAAESAGASQISLVAHSMGGLVARLLLEGGKYDQKPWYEKVKNLIALAVPHQGAPLALARILGVDSSLGISKSDFQRIAGDSRYPSGYQLLPCAEEGACWEQSTEGLQPVDFFNPLVAQRLGLDSELLERARYVHQRLNTKPPPQHIRYFYFAGTGHETVTRINVYLDDAGNVDRDRIIVTRTNHSGDGTVPMWSALPRAGQREVVIGEHSSVFAGMPFKRVFYRLLGGNLGSALETLGERDDPMRLSIASPIVECGCEFEILLVPGTPITEIVGKLVLQSMEKDGTTIRGEETLADVTYRGPPVANLRLVVGPLHHPGLFRLAFEGAPRNVAPLGFAVARLEP